MPKKTVASPKDKDKVTTKWPDACLFFLWITFGTRRFTRIEYLHHCLGPVVEKTNSIGLTPDATFSRVLQVLHDRGYINMNRQKRKGNTVLPGCYQIIKEINIEDLSKSCGSYGENMVAACLDDLGLAYIREKSFSDLRYERTHSDTSTRSYTGILRYDFWVKVPYKNGYFYVLIEFDGRQHFFFVEYFGDRKGFTELQDRDDIKDRYAIKKNIPLLRICCENKNMAKEAINSFLEKSIYLANRNKQVKNFFIYDEPSAMKHYFLRRRDLTVLKKRSFMGKFIYENNSVPRDDYKPNVISGKEEKYIKAQLHADAKRRLTTYKLDEEGYVKIIFPR